MRRFAALLVFLAPAVVSTAPKKNGAPDPIGVYRQVPNNLISLDAQHRLIEWDYTLDAYYSSVGMIVNFTDKPIENVGEASETNVYKNLLLAPLVPRYAILEASVNPMPVAGVLVREHANDVYQRAQAGGESFNLIRSATRGFQSGYWQCPPVGE